MIRTISTVDDRGADRTWERLCDMVARRAPGLMRSGGGALSQELRSPRAFTEVDRRQILALRAENKGCRDIAQIVGRRPAQVSEVCRVAGVPFRPRTRIAPAVRSEMRRRRARGQTFRAIAAGLGVHPDTVRRYEGVKARPEKKF